MENLKSIEIELTVEARHDMLPYPSDAIADLLIRKALGPAICRRLKHGNACCIVLVVPDSALLEPAMSALRELANGAGRLVLSEPSKKEGSAKNMAALAGASGGLPAVHICSDVHHVPRAFMAVAKVIRVPAIDGTLVRKAMRRCCRGAPPAAVATLDLSRMSFREICACIARGASATRAARVLAAVAGNSTTDSDKWLPELAECHEYGEARTWGLRVIRDVADWSAGRIPAEDLDTAALLVSDPGFGKTFFAGILAKSMGVPLIRFGVGELFSNDGYLHNTLAELRSAFARARAAAPAILFLDEIDSFPRRGTEDRNDSYFTALVNELLTLLDGASDRNTGVVILAATNREGEIDPALRRPGRLSTTIRLEMPNQAGLEHIYRVQLRWDLQGEDLSRIAALSVGSTPASVMHWVKLARSEARAQSRPLSMADLEHQVLGKRRATVRDLRKIAVHEAGHAVLACVLGRHGGGIEHVSLVPSNGSLGGAFIRDGDDRITNRRQLEERVLVLLAGRAAEELVLGEELSAGAGGPVGSDLWAATRVVSAILGSFGLGGSLLWRGSPEDMDDVLNRDAAFRNAADSLLVDLYARAKTLLSGRRHSLDAVAQALLERNVLSGQEVEDLVGPIERRAPLFPVSTAAPVLNAPAVP